MASAPRCRWRRTPPRPTASATAASRPGSRSTELALELGAHLLVPLLVLGLLGEARRRRERRRRTGLVALGDQRLAQPLLQIRRLGEALDAGAEHRDRGVDLLVLGEQAVADRDHAARGG